MADAMGPIVFVVVVFGGLGSLTGCFIAAIVMGMVTTFAVVIDTSIADLLRPLGISIAGDDLLGEIMTVPLARIGALLPLLMMVLILLFRPRGLMGTRDT
jgi:branched-chain amino acid transport system permease protein